MKEIKMSSVLLILMVAFLTFCLGYYFGDQAPGESFRVITQNTETSTAVAQAPQLNPTEPETTSPQPGIININTATAEELDALPGIGETIAGRIVAYRDEYGAFQAIEDLMLVEGIGEKRFEAIRDYVTLEENHENTGR